MTRAGRITVVAIATVVMVFALRSPGLIVYALPLAFAGWWARGGS